MLEYYDDGSKLRYRKYNTIKKVIEAVVAWKKLKKGITNKEGKIVKFSPAEAAEILGISYKTLYDYMFFLKKGKEYKFDFNLNQDEKMVVLRNYIKACDRRKKTLYKIPDLHGDIENNKTLESALRKLKMGSESVERKNSK